MAKAFVASPLNRAKTISYTGRPVESIIGWSTAAHGVSRYVLFDETFDFCTFLFLFFVTYAFEFKEFNK